VNIQSPSAVIDPVATVTHVRVRRWFYINVALGVIGLNLASFGPSIVAPSSRTVPLPLTPLVVAHTAIACAWILFFLGQSVLIATGRTRLHRRWGVVGGVLAVMFVVVGCLAAIDEARRGFDLSGDLVPRGTMPDPSFILAPVNAFPLFAVLVGAALWYRRRPEIHKRLMLLTMLGPVAGAPIAHLVGHWSALRGVALPVALGSTVLLLSLSAIHDWFSECRVHPVSVWGAVGTFVWFNMFFVVIAPSAAWRDFTAWLIA